MAGRESPERDCPRPLLPRRESAIKALVRPALDTPSAGSHPPRGAPRSRALAAQPRPPPANHRECRDPRGLGSARRAARVNLLTLCGALGRWEGRARLSLPAPTRARRSWRLNPLPLRYPVAGQLPLPGPPVWAAPLAYLSADEEGDHHLQPRAAGSFLGSRRLGAFPGSAP